MKKKSDKTIAIWMLICVCWTFAAALSADAATGDIATIAGNGSEDFSGDGGPATDAGMSPWGLFVDVADNLYIADADNHRIRKVDAQTQVITTIAGDGFNDITRPSGGRFSGDGSAATDASLSSPSGIFVDSADNLYIADTGNHRVRKVDAQTGIITTVAGDGFEDPSSFGAGRFSGDGGAATDASLNSPGDLFMDGAGNLYIADTGNLRVRKVDAQTGIITTVAGNGGSDFSGDGGPATDAGLNVEGIFIDSTGDLYIADYGNLRVRKVDAQTGIITTVAGSESDALGDGGAAVEAGLAGFHNVFVDGAGDLYIADKNNDRVRRVDAQTGIITTVAGSGIEGFTGDGGPATDASLSSPSDVFADGAGNLYIVDSSNSRIRRVEGIAVPAAQAPALTLSAISPDSGSAGGGTAVVLTGTGFASGATVRIGGVSATGVVVVVSEAEIRAVTPSAPVNPATGGVMVGPQDVAVTVAEDRNGNGVIDSDESRSATLAGGFTYSPLITLTAISPAAGAADGGTAVVLTGTGFVSGVTVAIGGVPATGVVVVSGTEIRAVTPPGAAGAQDVAVTVARDRNGNGAIDPAERVSATLTGAFTYPDVTPPSVVSTAPVSGSRDLEPEGIGASGVVIAFSEAMDTAGIGIDVQAGGTSVTWVPAWSDGDTKLTLKPGSGDGVDFETAYRITLSRVADAAGNAAADVVISFTTKQAPPGAVALDLNPSPGYQGARRTAGAVAEGEQVAIDIVAVSGAEGIRDFEAQLEYDGAQLAFVGFEAVDLMGHAFEVASAPSGGTVAVRAEISKSFLGMIFGLAHPVGSASGSLLRATFRTLPGFSGEAEVRLAAATYDNAPTTVGPGGTVVTIGEPAAVIPGGPVALDLDLSSGDQGLRRTASTPKPGDIVAIDLAVTEGAQGIVGAEVVVAFDPLQLAFSAFEASASDLMPTLGPGTTPEPGRAVLANGTLPPGASQDAGSLGRVSFEVLSGFTGQTAVRIVSAKFGDPDLNEIVLDVSAGGATVTIGREGSTSGLLAGSGYPALAPDFDGDGAVGFSDFAAFAQRFGAQQGEADYAPGFDLDGDGQVGATDLLRLVRDFGRRAAAAKPAPRAAPGANAQAGIALAVLRGGPPDHVEVAVRVEEATEVHGYSLVVRYDPSALELLESVTQQSLAFVPTSGPRPVALTLSSDPGAVTLVDAMGTTVQGEGELARLSFRVLDESAPGRVEIAGVLVSDGSGRVNELAGARLEGIRALPSEYTLAQNYPNPFNPQTQIAYQLPEAGEISLAIYNLLGQEVRVLFSGYQRAGFHRVVWDGRDAYGRQVSSGVYLYRFASRGLVQSRRMMLLK